MYLSFVNPWWTGSITEDPDYFKWFKRKVKWTPSLAEEIVSCVKRKGVHVNFIIGPRQIGKTTAVKIAVKTLLEKGLPPRSVFYYRCDLLSDYRELLKVIEGYLDLAKIEGFENCVIFLDEVNMVSEWFRAVKYLIDIGAFKNTTLFLTGSSSIRLFKETDRLPGRRGEGKDLIALPVSFPQFTSIENPKLYNELTSILSKVEVKSLNDLLHACQLLQPFLGELNRCFEKYLEAGGFPLSILEYYGEEKGAKESLLSSLRYDVERVGRNIGLLKDILTCILSATPAPVSYDKIAKEVGVSKATVQDYIQLAKDLLIMVSLEQIDPHKLKPVPRKERKYHFIDPHVYNTFSYWCDVHVKKEYVIEATAIAHILRLVNWKRVLENTVYFWRNKREVDLIVKIDEEFIGFEVTWSPFKETVTKIGKVRKVIQLDKEECNTASLKVPLTAFLVASGIKGLSSLLGSNRNTH